MNQRDFDDKVIDGLIVLPHAPMSELIAMVQEDLRAGAPDALYVIEGVVGEQELPLAVERALRAHFGC